MAQKDKWSGSRVMEITQSEQQTNEKENNIRVLWGNTKHANLHTTAFSEGQERQRRTENIFKEIMAKSIRNIKMEADI